MRLKIDSISWRIGLAVAGVIFVFGAITMWSTYTFSVSKYTAEKKSEAIMVVTHGTRILEEILTQSGRLVQSVAKDKLVVDLIKNKKNEKSVISQLENYNPDKIYSAIYVMGNDGIVLASTDASFMKQDYSFREYFMHASQGELYNDVNLGVTSKKLGYYFSYPIKNEKEEIVGVAVIKMNPEIITEILKNILEKPMSDLLMTDKYGIVVNSAHGERLYQSLGKLTQTELNKVTLEKKYSGVEIGALQYDLVMNLIREKVVGVKTVKLSDEEDDDEEVLVMLPISKTGFYLVGEISMGGVITQASNMSRTIGLMIVLSVISSMALVILLSRKLLMPIGNLTQMARDIALGKFNQLNPVVGGGELEILGTSMINMADELGDKYSDLEKLVDERTAKMDEQNQSLEKGKLAILNILEDVALAKSDLEKFKLAVNEASDHVIITDSEGIILYANKAVEKITGFSNLEVIGKKAGNGELWGGLMDKVFYKKLWKTIKIDKKNFTSEVNNKRKNGEKYVVMSTITPIIDEKGGVQFFVGIERDITHEKEVDRMKTDFISLASHQLRTPLAAMSWFTEMLLTGDAGKLSKEQTEFVTNIQEANARMIVLVNSLLNISRIESGRIVVDPEPTDLKDLVDQELKEIDNQIKEKKQTVLVSVAKNLPKINIDPKLTAEVYKNLLTNANKYSPEGGEIEVYISHKEGEIISQVSDNGIGIPISSQNKIFERFYRATNVVKLETEGTGLGLYLAKAIVESSGGKMWFNSEEGKGSTFWFSLPLKRVKKKVGEVAINS